MLRFCYFLELRFPSCFCDQLLCERIIFNAIIRTESYSEQAFAYKDGYLNNIKLINLKMHLFTILL